MKGNRSRVKTKTEEKSFDTLKKSKKKEEKSKKIKKRRDTRRTTIKPFKIERDKERMKSYIEREREMTKKERTTERKRGKKEESAERSSCVKEGLVSYLHACIDFPFTHTSSFSSLSIF